MRAVIWTAFAVLFARGVFAQSEVHASAPNTIPEMRSRFVRGRYELGNATLVDLIRTAWNVDAENVAGGPDWLDRDRFDVIAAAPAGSTPEALRAMLRGLLEERFQLVIHTGTKDVPAYAMTVGKKLQLQEADGSEETGCRIQPSRNPVVYECRNMTMATFAAALTDLREASGYLFNYRVVDRTGLKGAWNYSVKWSPRFARIPAPTRGDAITIFDAFEKQLGLKLELTRIPTPTIVVDSVNEKPTGNTPGVTEKPRVPPEFEVADIKPDPALRECSNVGIQPGGRVRVAMTLKGLIQEAWGDMNPWRVLGGPGLSNSTCFVVVAKAPTQEDGTAGWNGPVWNGVDIDSMRMMLRALLVERFGLVAHDENRQVTGYALVAAKPRLRKADPANRPGCREGPGADGKDPRLTNPMASRLLTCRNMTLAQFAAELNNVLYGYPPVVDATGIAGRYDMTINFTPPAAIRNIGVPGPGSEGVASEPDGTISIFDGLSRQLGLKLKSSKVIAPVLVVDRVNEKPTEN